MCMNIYDDVCCIDTVVMVYTVYIIYYNKIIPSLRYTMYTATENENNIIKQQFHVNSMYILCVTRVYKCNIVFDMYI